MQAFFSPFRSLALLALAVVLHASCTLIADAQLDDKPPSSTSSSSSSSSMGGTGNGGAGGTGGGGSSIGGGGSAPCDGMCTGSETCCPDGCFVLQTDVNHCGTCDKPCASGEKCCGGTCTGCCMDADCPTVDHTCLDNVCVLECTAPAMKCDDVCADLDTSSQHCGSCGNDCLSGHPCVGGSCQPGWATMSEVGALSPRQRAAATWTGSKLFIWGGLNPQGALDDGALYDPKTDTWTMLPSVNSPGARVDAVAIAMNDQVMVWGGGPNGGTTALNSGKLFDLGSSTWKDVSSMGGFGSRNPIAAWTGTKVLLWGGTSNGFPISNARIYEPTTDTWTPMNGSNAPSARTGVGWTWSGTELLMFGGRPMGTGASGAGYGYNPATDKWRILSTTNAPGSRYDTFAAWTGTSMLVVGGRNMAAFADAALYDPIMDTWTAAPASPLGKRSAPAPRTGWVSSGTAKIVVLGGLDEAQSSIKVDGHVYDSTVNDWGAQSLAWPSGAHHEFGVGVWTGAEFILWSGLDNSVLTPLGERYRP